MRSYGDTFTEHFNLAFREITHAKAAYLSTAVQELKRLTNLVWIHQEIWTVKEQNINIICIQVTKAVLCALQYVLFRTVVGLDVMLWLIITNA